MGNKESHEYIDVDSVGHEVGLYLKNCLSPKFNDLRGEKLIKRLRGGAIGQRNKTAKTNE